MMSCRYTTIWMLSESISKEHILKTASSMISDAPSSSNSLRDFAESAGLVKHFY